MTDDIDHILGSKDEVFHFLPSLHKATTKMSKVARAHFTPSQKEEFIGEGIGLTARNSDQIRKEDSMYANDDLTTNDIRLMMPGGF